MNNSETKTDTNSAAPKYDFHKVELYWQKKWEEDGLFTAPDMPDSDKEKFYMLVMFAYPSGDIHMGHFRNYIIGDAVARRELMLGKQVMHPFGWDAFGLPAERAAIKRNLNPADWTESNIGVSRETLQKVGISFDWSREVVTCRKDYYRWSQWLFLKLFEKGLAYLKEALVNWCPDCLTVLANEQVVNGICERCDSKVQKKELRQWYFKITDYADRLVDDLDKLSGWPDNVKSMQREWIGRSYGAEATFQVEDEKWNIPVYTTRLDTIYGVTFLALAPESKLAERLNLSDAKRKEIDDYRQEALLKTEIDRGSETDEKTGIFSGLYAINPFSGERIPIWIADYVLAHYGTGAVMGVPHNDMRDKAFAQKYNLPIRQVLKTADGSEISDGEVVTIENGITVNSGRFSDLPSSEAIESMSAFAEKGGFGKKTKQFKLHDWLISRQRYWGTPIPIIHCDKCGLVPVAESALPVELPIITDYLPKGRSPLADVASFTNVKCPRCNSNAKRDADTMDTFVCSSWYHLRYADPENKDALFNTDKANAWLPVDKYIGGITHATGHLIFFRFITKFLSDLGLINFDEPAKELFNHGMVSDSEGKVMSKSRGNVVSPIELMKERGVDVTRLAMYFTAPSDKEVLWSDAALVGVEKFLLNKVCNLADLYDAQNTDLKYHFKKSELTSAEWDLYVGLNQRLKRRQDDYDNLQYNTVIASMMELSRDIERAKAVKPELRNYAVRCLIQTLAPLIPHTAEEIWASLGFTKSIFLSGWPIADPDALVSQTITMGVQINGKVRGEISIAPDAIAEVALSEAKACESVIRHLEGKTIIKEIYIPGRVLNIVAK